MTLRTRRGIAAILVAAAFAATGSGLAGAAVSQADRPAPDALAATPPAGVGLSPEVAAVPASSPELDAAMSELRGLEADRDRQRNELDAGTAELARTSTDLGAMTALVARRQSQVEKAAGVAERSSAALRELTIERFVTGDHLMEGLDPSLTLERRTELARHAVLGQVGTDQVLREHRFSSARLQSLQADLDDLSTRERRLQARSGELAARTASLEASLGELEPRIEAARTRADAARRTADIDGTDLSAVALDAYWRAERYLAAIRPSCGLTWPVLAGIGRTESHHGTYRGATLAPDGVVTPPIYGPDLDGSNAFAVVPDSDGGTLDATTRTDRAVGPMQFLPGTWRTVGTDMDGDGTADPQNLFDAAAAAGVYLCRSGPGLEDPARLRAAVLTYNRSQSYADLVAQRASEYATAVPLR